MRKLSRKILNICVGYTLFYHVLNLTLESFSSLIIVVYLTNRIYILCMYICILLLELASQLIVGISAVVCLERLHYNKTVI